MRDLLPQERRVFERALRRSVRVIEPPMRDLFAGPLFVTTVLALTTLFLAILIWLFMS